MEITYRIVRQRLDGNEVWTYPDFKSATEAAFSLTLEEESKGSTITVERCQTVASYTV